MLKNPQRPLNSASPMKSLNVGTLPAAPVRSRTEGEGIARAGAPKRTVDAPIKPGMTRQSSGEPHPYLHGVTVQDEPNAPLKSYEQKIPVHPGMTDEQRAKIDASNDPNAILQNAANLGRKA